MHVLAKSHQKHVLFLTYHLPLGNHPGPCRPWMEAKLINKAGYKVTVVTLGVQHITEEDIRNGTGWYSEEKIEEIRILRTWGPKQYRKNNFKRILHYLAFSIIGGLVSICKVKNVDFVFVGTHPLTITPVAYLVSKLKRSRLVLDERDLYPETAIGMGMLKDGMLAGVLLKVQQFIRSASYSILTPTPGIRNKLISDGIDQNKIHLLLNGDVYFSKNVLELQNTRDLKQITGKKFIIGFAGSMGRVSDITTFINAIEMLTDIKCIGFVILGSGESRAAYQSVCEERDLDNVYFFDALPRDEARAIQMQFDICVHLYPSVDIFEIAMASKIFDYMALGKPVVFCGRGDTANLLERSDSGISVTPEQPERLSNELRSLYSDNERREKMGVNAREWFEKNISENKGIDCMKQLFS